MFGMSDKQFNTPTFLQRYAALIWTTPGNYADNAEIWQRTRDTAEFCYRRARLLMGIN